MKISIAEARKLNAEAGYHFFSPDTMRFFKSRVHGQTTYAGGYFITSEQYEGMDGSVRPRRYTVRQILPDGDVNTVGEFQQYADLNRARRVARSLGHLSGETFAR